MADDLTENADAADRRLVARWLGGDDRAATEIVERHAPALARFAASQGAREDADELVQDTFVRAFRALDAFRGESSVRTWLFSILRRLVVDRRRAARRAPVGAGLSEGDAATEFGALDAIVATETEGRLRDALARLTRTQREVFTLRVAEGMSYRDIADVVGSTEGAARVHYHNAMRALKEHVDD